MGAEQTVVVVDDSALMRAIISGCLDKMNGLRVVGKAVNGAKGIEMIRKYKPDIVSLDIELGDMSGLDVLREVMKENPCKVIVVSSQTEAGAETSLRALSLGAVECIAKGKVGAGNDSFEASLQRSFGAAMLAKTTRLGRGSSGLATSKSAATTKRSSRLVRRPGTDQVELGSPELVLIASSTGGPMALQAFLAELSQAPLMPVVLVQHMPESFTARLASLLDRLGPTTVKEAEDGEPLKAGKILIARGKTHLEVHRRHVSFSDVPAIAGLKPRADITFESAVKAFGGKIVAFVLTGMGDDGLIGCEAVVKAGGLVVAQDPDSCVVDGMPGSVRDADLVVDYGPPAYLGHLLDRLSTSMHPVHSPIVARV